MWPTQALSSRWAAGRTTRPASVSTSAERCDHTSCVRKERRLSPALCSRNRGQVSLVSTDGCDHTHMCACHECVACARLLRERGRDGVTLTSRRPRPQTSQENVQGAEDRGQTRRPSRSLAVREGAGSDGNGTRGRSKDDPRCFVSVPIPRCPVPVGVSERRASPSCRRWAWLTQRPGRKEKTFLSERVAGTFQTFYSSGLER